MSYLDIQNFCIEVKKHLHRCYMHRVRKEKHLHPCHSLVSASAAFSLWDMLQQVPQQWFPYRPQPRLSLLLPLSQFSKVLYASVSPTHLFFQTHSLLLLQGQPNSHQRSFAPTRYMRLPVCDRRLTAAGLDSWHGRRTPVPVQASVFRLLLYLYTKKGTQMFFISYNAGLSLGRHAYTSYYAIYLLVLRGTKLEQFMQFFLSYLS